MEGKKKSMYRVAGPEERNKCRPVDLLFRWLSHGDFDHFYLFLFGLSFLSFLSVSHFLSPPCLSFWLPFPLRISPSIHFRVVHCIDEIHTLTPMLLSWFNNDVGFVFWAPMVSTVDLIDVWWRRGRLIPSAPIMWSQSAFKAPLC